MTAPIPIAPTPARAPALGRDYALLWSGQLLSMTGTMIQYIALPLWVLAETGSALASGLTFAIETLPVIALAPWAGVLADRHDRRRLVLAGELVSAVAVLALFGAISLHSVLAALVCAVLIKTINTVTVPALQGLIREVVPEGALPAAVSRFEGLTGATIVLGPPAGALLFASVGPSAALLVNALTFAVCAVCVSAIRTRSAATTSSAGPAATAAPTQPRPRLGGGFTLVRTTPRLRALLGAEAAYFLCFGGTTAAVIVTATRDLGESAAGWYPACVGGAWVFVSMAVLPGRDWTPRTSLLLGAAFVPLTAIAVAARGAAPLALLLIAGVLGGVANSLIAAGASIGWQKTADASMIGQVMALRRSVVNAALALSSAVLPALAQHFSLGGVLVIGSLASVGLVAACLAGWNRQDATP
ncbi:MFS transporter [Streptomyces sp. A1136]|uniref:MFS transporter n=1 Tax=Streptomyces sp. A1136 TaxID=2563102 RepID=UPI00144833A0|nr:MFS transporter [Streptomyces sp. A1136]